MESNQITEGETKDTQKHNHHALKRKVKFLFIFINMQSQLHRNTVNERNTETKKHVSPFWFKYPNQLQQTVKKTISQFW